MDILGIETSCDETAAAVVRDGREVLTNVVYTQIPLHRPYGGVVPEIASRAHVEKISQVVGEAMKGQKVDAVAVTYGPGLSPALIVGLNAAKGLAKALGVPLVGINHLEGHLHSPFLWDSPEDATRAFPDPKDLGPALGLVVSGGNTVWVDLPEAGRYEVIGETLDDAAGEAFDKAAKLLGLGYPGGLKIDRMSQAWRERERSRLEVEVESGISQFHSPPQASTSTLIPPQASTSTFIPFPKGRPREGVTALAGLPAELCVSFSGLKTALLRHVQQHPESLAEPELSRVVASYQEAIAKALADRTRTALRRRRYSALVLGGGVSLNSRIRALLAEACADARVPLLMAKPKYTGDNGAMIAGLAFTRRNHEADAMRLDADPCLEIGA